MPLPPPKDLDLNVVALTRAMRTIETGGDYSKKGASGELGSAYQFMPKSWKEWAGKYIGDPNAPLSKENQDFVAYSRVKELKDKGHTPDEILAIWNSGGPNYKGKKGVNSAGVKYDVPLHVEKGLREFQKEVAKLGGRLPTASAASAPGIAPLPPIQQSTLLKTQPKKPLDARVADTIAEAGKGVVKGVGSTMYGLVKVGEKIGKATGLEKLTNKIFGQNVPLDIGPKPEVLSPTNRAQKVGFATEQVAEFFVPAGKVAAADKAIDAIRTAKKVPAALRTAATIGAKAASEGTAAAGVRYAQTGGDAKQAAVAGVTAGAARGALATAGAALRAIRLPERMYSTIFKNSLTDMRTFLKSQGVAALKKESPELYDELVKRGAIREIVGKPPKVNETLAREVLDRGIKGNLSTMANEVVKRTLILEDKAQSIASKAGKVKVTEPQFRKVLKDIADGYENVGFGEVSKEADELRVILERTKGQPSATDALRLRRFLDKMRVRSSYESPNPSNLSLSQQNFRTLTDSLRSRLSKISGMKDTMNEYRIYIEAMDRIAREATRRGNNQVIGLIDSVLFGAGSFVNPVVGAGVSFGRKMFTSPAGSTVVGNLLNKGVSTRTGVGIRGAFGAGASALPKPTSQNR